jgi:hypothetical protein
MLSAFLPRGVLFGRMAEIQKPILYLTTLMRAGRNSAQPQQQIMSGSDTSATSSGSQSKSKRGAPRSDIWNHNTLTNLNPKTNRYTAACNYCHAVIHDAKWHQAPWGTCQVQLRRLMQVFWLPACFPAARIDLQKLPLASEKLLPLSVRSCTVYSRYSTVDSS